MRIDERDVAFVPAPLPPGWVLEEGTWALLAEAMHELGRLDGVAINLQEPGILLRPLENREALRSSSLEGTYATPQELLLFELPAEGADQSAESNAWREVYNYRSALSQSQGVSVVESPLVLIRQLHKLLLSGVRGSDRTPGAFRTTQVYIGADHRFVPPPPTHLTQCLAELEEFIRGPANLPPLVRSFLVHYQFETIHPFLDGNGRVGRLLMTLMLREFCGHRRPWLYLSAYLDRYKDDYIDHLFAISARGEWSEWIDFCLKATIVQAKDTFERCNRLLSLREEYRHKVGVRPRLPAIVDQLFINPFTRAASLTTAMNVSYPTAKGDVDRLTELGILRELPSLYPRTHYAHAIYEIAFHEPDRGAPPVDDAT